MPDIDEILKLTHEEILNLKAILDPMAKDFPVFVRGLASTIDNVQELEEGKSHHSKIMADLFTRICTLEGKQAMLEQLINLKFLEMWKRIADVRQFVGMPPESEE